MLNSTPIFTTDHVTSNLPSLKGPCDKLLGVIPQVPAPSLSSALCHPLPGISKPPIAICTQESRLQPEGRWPQSLTTHWQPE